MKRITAITAAIILLVYIAIMAGGCDSCADKAKYRELIPESSDIETEEGKNDDKNIEVEDSDMNKAKYQKTQLHSFSIKTGGGMNGGNNILEVNSDMENNIVTVWKLVRYMYYLKPRAELYVVDSSLLDEIKQIIIDERLYDAPNIPRSDMEVLDADTTSYHVTFSDGEYFSYSSVQELTTQIYNANDRIKTVIEKYCDNATAIPTVYAEAEEDYTFWEESEEITIDCTNESPFCVKLNIYNGKSDKAELKGNVTLSKMDGGKVVYTDTLIEDYTMEVDADREDYIIVTFPVDNYPGEGTYKMEYAGYETTFEMKVYKAETRM